jgi:hypothetical protein
MNNQPSYFEDAARANRVLKPFRFACGSAIDIQYCRADRFAVIVHWDESFAVRAEAESLHWIAGQIARYLTRGFAHSIPEACGIHLRERRLWKIGSIGANASRNYCSRGRKRHRFALA